MTDQAPLTALALRMIRASDICEQGHKLGSANPHVHADVVHDYGRTLLDAVRTDVVRSTPMTEPGAPLTEWRRMYLQLLDSWTAVCDAAGLDGDAEPDEIVARLQRRALSRGSR